MERVDHGTDRAGNQGDETENRRRTGVVERERVLKKANRLRTMMPRDRGQNLVHSEQSLVPVNPCAQCLNLKEIVSPIKIEREYGTAETHKIPDYVR